MANAYSTPINYGQTIPTTDLAQYVGAIQSGMQQKFDINLAKIDDLISKVATVPLARDKDKKYLGEKLQGLLSMVDANSKVDLSDNVVARQISSYVTTAIDSNVREQLANSQKIASYQQTAAQRKKDKPELYSDANYTYGLDKSGYADYMSEKKDSLGTMDYIDYYDVDKNLNKELEAFAKERGFEKVLDSSVEGGYIFKTVKGKEITKEEVSNFYDNKLASDPKLKQQFMINAHYNYRGVSDEALIKSYKEQADPILKEFDTQISDIDNKLKNVSPDDKATADYLHRQKSEMEAQKTNFSTQLDPKNFNRDSFLLDNYSRNMKKSYINTYAYSAVTDIKFDDFLLDIAKAKGEIAADGTSTGIGAVGLPGGTKSQSAPGTEIKLPLSSLPPAIVKNLQTSLSDWSYAANNPTRMEVSMAYSPPNNLESRYDLAQNYIKNYGSSMTEEEVKSLQMTGFSALKTKEDYQKQASRQLPPEFASDFNSKYLNSKYAVKWERPEGGGAFIGYLMKDGTKIEQVPAMNTDYNPHAYSLLTMKIISQYLENQIVEYRRKALQ